MWLPVGLEQQVMLGGAIVLAIAGPIIAASMVLRHSWERPRRIFWLYTLIFESTAVFALSWGMMTLPRALWLQRVLEFAAIGMLILAMILVSRLATYVSPQTRRHRSATADRH